jgi:hypothetical protein
VTFFEKIRPNLAECTAARYPDRAAVQLAPRAPRPRSDPTCFPTYLLSEEHPVNSATRTLAVGALALGAILGTTWTRSTAGDTSIEPGYKSLFNGKDLTGWYYKSAPKVSLEGKTETPDGRISVENGAIVMHEKDSKGKGGIRDLYTVANFPKNFNLKLEFRAALKADSGVYLRGPQLQVRDFIRRNEHKHLKKFKNDDWNELDITVTNGVVTTTVNGRALTPKDSLELTVKEGQPEARLNGKQIPIKSLSIDVGAVAECLCNGEKLETMRKLPANGGIGLQAETCKFEFRRIRVKEMP